MKVLNEEPPTLVDAVYPRQPPDARKPHVRWCGRGDGRNPVTPTRSGCTHVPSTPTANTTVPSTTPTHSFAEGRTKALSESSGLIMGHTIARERIQRSGLKRS